MNRTVAQTELSTFELGHLRLAILGRQPQNGSIIPVMGSLLTTAIVSRSQQMQIGVEQFQPSFQELTKVAAMLASSEHMMKLLELLGRVLERPSTR